jgi:hypothetical protein
MSVLSVKNLQETFIGKNIARTASAQIISPDAAAYIADGEVLVLNSTGVPMTTSTTNTYAASPWIQLVQRNGNNLVFSSKIYGNKVTSYLGRAGAQGQEQIYHIGYNGTSGSLDITAGLDFQLTLIENQDDMMWSEQKKKNVTSVPNNLVTSQQDLAKAVVENVMRKYINDGISVTAAMLNSGTSATIGAVTLNVTHGSNVITYSGTATGVVAGSVVRIGATGMTVASVTTCPVYTVQGAHPTIANAFILDQPYAGPTNATLANAAHGLIASPGASWGVRFTGKYLTSYRRDFFKFKRTAFTVQMSGFGATAITKTQDMGYGYGDGRLVLEEESFSKGFEGALNRMSVPLPIANETFTADGSFTSSINTTYGDAFITATTLYDAITIEFFSQNAGTVVSSAPMPQLIKIFMADGAAQGNTDNTTKAVQTALNQWMPTVPGAFATLSVFA